MNPQDFEQLTLFPVDSRDCASRSAWPGSDGAVRMTVTSGRKCLELSRSCGPLGSLEKMLLESSAWRSTRRYLTWKVSATPARRLLFRLVPSTPRTGETDAPLWPTATGRCGRGASKTATRQGGPDLQTAVAMFPTPTRFDAECGDLKGKEYNGQSRHAMKLIQAAKLYTTPCASDAQGTSGGNNSRSLRTDVGGQLNPMWGEWLMGFPLGWTDLNASETP